MRVIGLLGGMSWESTAVYYRILNQEVRRRLGGQHSARILLYSLDFEEIERFQDTAAWDRAGQLLAAYAQELQRAGADLVLLCTNTMHKVAGVIEAAIDIPLIHIADAAAEKVKSEGLTRLGLLGTRFTMEEDFYRDRLSQHGLQVLVPDADERREVDRVIYEELCMGRIRDESRDAYREIIGILAGRGAEGVILGCTEIGLLVGPGDAPIPIFDTTRIHAESAVERALAE